MSTPCEGSRTEVFDAEAFCTSWLETCPRRNRKANKSYARGVADGRGRVVADLREQAADPTWSVETRALLTLMADRYERGEHEREAT